MEDALLSGLDETDKALYKVIMTVSEKLYIWLNWEVK
ncbi:hypothetical protein Clo1100_1409 [Clostridium sp. BNL1100]|nr:hypothetical protein Clo1100_1409 [Clostridium sp. BNL1100]